MNHKKLILFLLIVLIILGVNMVSATAMNSNNTDTKDTSHIKEKVHIENQEKINKEITKKNTDKKIKTDTPTKNASNFEELSNALTSTDYASIQVNIQKDIQLENSISVALNLLDVKINGNNHIIDGRNTCGFLVDKKRDNMEMKDLHLNVNNMTIQNCGNQAISARLLNINFSNLQIKDNDALSSSVIMGELVKGTITNCTFTRNTGYNSGALYLTSSEVNITDTTFKENMAWEDGGALKTVSSDINIKNTKFEKTWPKTGVHSIISLET